MFAIIEGPAEGWASPSVVAAFVVLARVAFVLWELRTKRPMLDPRLFLLRPLAAGTLAMTMSHVAIFGLFFVVLQYLQRIRSGWRSRHQHQNRGRARRSQQEKQFRPDSRPES